MDSDVKQTDGDIDKEKPLRSDVRFLGNLLGELLTEQEGKRIFDIIEPMTFLTKEMRRKRR